MHVLEDSAIFSSLQQQQRTKGNDGRARALRYRLRVLFILGIFALSCVSLFFLHGMVSSLHIESEDNVTKAISKNAEYRIDEGVLIEFHVSNLNGNIGDTASFMVQTKPSWSKLGAKRFEELTHDGFWNQCRFFRAIHNFIVQWGINGDHTLNDKWSAYIEDEGVKESNVRGTISFAMAGPGTRGHQMFINLKNNKFLDGQGFAPVAKVISGMDIVDQIYNGYGESPKQNLIRSGGNTYLDENFPKLTYISAAIVKHTSNEN